MFSDRICQACGHEPTSALDPEIVKEVPDVMINLAQEGMTMMVVSHEMGFAKSVAHRVLFMVFGRMVESNTPAEFFNHPQHDRTQLFLSQILHGYFPCRQRLSYPETDIFLKFLGFYDMMLNIIRAGAIRTS